ncbi:MAG: hypothetical protein EB140_09960, partial [Proteobacteria bacterium]|nr:hypothetical protein [Pseudomonadota bacterium]
MLEIPPSPGARRKSPHSWSTHRRNGPGNISKTIPEPSPPSCSTRCRRWLEGHCPIRNTPSP